MKKTHKCHARAHVSVSEPEGDDESDGPASPLVYTLTEIHSPSYHSHEPENTKFIANSIMQMMKDEITKNPCNRIGEFNIFC